MKVGAKLPEALFAGKAFSTTKIVAKESNVAYEVPKPIYHNLSIDKDKYHLKCILLTEIHI